MPTQPQKSSAASSHHQPERARLSQNEQQLPSFFHQFVWKNWIQQQLSLILETGIRPHSKTTPTTEIASNFHLFDTLVEFAEILATAPTETLSPTETDAFDRATDHLERTLRTQLQAGLAEYLHMPHHSDANEVDLDSYVTTGNLRIIHPHYADKDLIEFCQKAIDSHSPITHPEHHTRYTRERNQLVQLYTEKLLPEISSQHPETTWTETTAETLLTYHLRQRYQLTDTDTIYSGQKHAFSLPFNKAVYPEGMAYINLYQLVYLPQHQKILLLMDQFYNELDLTAHAEILQNWQPSPTLQQISPTEAALMDIVVTLPNELTTTPAFQIFANLADQYKTDHLPDSLTYFAKQQTSLGFITQSQENIKSSATFLTHILVTEYLLCQQFPEALNTLPQRLRVAFEMAFHPLSTGKTVPYQASIEAYEQAYLTPWKHQTTQFQPSQGQFALQALQQLQQQRNQLDQNFTITDHQQRNAALLQLSHSYPDILNKALGNAMCMSGSMGGLAPLQKLTQSGLGQSILQGHLPNYAELAHIVGEERAKLWKMGKCINPHCANKDETQLVGECQLCLRCELEFQLKEALDGSSLSPKPPDWENLLHHQFLSPEKIVDAYRQKLAANDLPIFMMGAIR